jgi:hypothetical protein
LEDNYAWVLRCDARRIQEQLAEGGTATLDQRTAERVCEGLEVAASYSERKPEIEETELRMARAECAYYERNLRSKARLTKMARMLGFLRMDGKRGKAIHRMRAAEAYDVLTITGTGLVTIEDPLGWRAGIRNDITNPLAINFEQFSIREFGDSKRPSWLVTGCPITPEQALETLQQAFEYASPAAVHRALEEERAENNRIRERLEPYKDVPEVREYLDDLPKIKRLGPRPDARPPFRKAHRTTSASTTPNPITRS